MKFTVTMKDPDALHDAIESAVKKQLKKELPGLSDDEREMLVAHRAEVCREVASDWFEYGEYLAVEIDTEARTCSWSRVV